MFSFPVTIDDSGRYRIVENMEISDDIKEKIQEIIKVKKLANCKSNTG